MVQPEHFQPINPVEVVYNQFELLAIAAGVDQDHFSTPLAPETGIGTLVFDSEQIGTSHVRKTLTADFISGVSSLPLFSLRSFAQSASLDIDSVKIILTRPLSLDSSPTDWQIAIALTTPQGGREIEPENLAPHLAAMEIVQYLNQQLLVDQSPRALALPTRLLPDNAVNSLPLNDPWAKWAIEATEIRLATLQHAGIDRIMEALNPLRHPQDKRPLLAWTIEAKRAREIISNWDEDKPIENLDLIIHMLVATNRGKFGPYPYANSGADQLWLAAQTTIATKGGPRPYNLRIAVDGRRNIHVSCIQVYPAGYKWTPDQSGYQYANVLDIINSRLQPTTPIADVFATISPLELRQFTEAAILQVTPSDHLAAVRTHLDQGLH